MNNEPLIIAKTYNQGLYYSRKMGINPRNIVVRENKLRGLKNKTVFLVGEYYENPDIETIMDILYWNNFNIFKVSEIRWGEKWM